MALLKLHSELDQQRMAVLEPHIREKPGNITPLAKKRENPIGLHLHLALPSPFNGLATVAVPS